MGTVCLSNAPILRCQSFTRLENGVMLIPSGLEVIFSFTLLFAKRSGRKHYYLSAEGVVYLILAGVDFLAHMLPSPRQSLGIFRGLDIFVGALSSVPMLLYTLYLFYLTTQDVLPGFPRRLQMLTKYVLLAFIPFIAVINELASFIGLSYHVLQDGRGGQIIALGYTDQNIRTFLDSFTLILLVVYQTLCFAASFFRLIKAFINQRGIDDANRADDEVHLFNGLGWIAGGIKLGAVESIVGFVDASFGLALTRRMLKLLGRACLIIGVVKGVDMVEDFQFVKAAKPQRRSMLRALIQNPRYSTFQQVGGHNLGGIGGVDAADVVPPEIRAARVTPALVIAPTTLMSSTAMSDLQRPMPGTSYRMADPPSDPLPPEAYRDLSSFSKPRTPEPAFIPKERVTVEVLPNRPPTLILRPVSDLDVPDPIKPENPLDNASKELAPAIRPQTDVATSTRTSSRPATMSFPVPDALSAEATFEGLAASPPIPLFSPGSMPEESPLRKAARYTIAGRPEAYNVMSTAGSVDFPSSGARKSSMLLPRESMLSAYSADSLEVVRTLAGEFPNLPPRRVASKSKSRRPVTLQSPIEIDEDDTMTAADSANVSRNGSARSQASKMTTSTRGGSLARRSSSVRRKPVPKATMMSEDEVTLVTQSAPVSRSNSLKEFRSQLQNLPTPPPVPLTTPDSISSFDTSRPPPDRRYTSIPFGPMPPVPLPPPMPLATPDSILAFDTAHPLPDRRYTSIPTAASQYRFPRWNSKSDDDKRSTLEFPWVERAEDVDVEGQIVLEEARKSVSSRSVTRIKSFGAAPRRTTPTVTQNEFYRESIVAEWFDAPEDLRKQKISEASRIASRRSFGDRYRDVERGNNFAQRR